MISHSIEDHCQYWLNENSGVLKSPNHPSYYDLNLNCKWILKADQGFYVNLELILVKVKNQT